MAAKILIVAAVPFHTAVLQATLNRKVVRKVTEVEKYKRIERDPSNSSGSGRIMQNSTTVEKLRFRLLKNKTAAQAYRGKAKHVEKILKQHVSRLKYEKMKLLIKNEALRRQNTELEVKNGSPKFKVQNLYDLFKGKGREMEAAFKRASFVSIPLLKEWVVPKIFFFLLMSVWESLKQNALIPNYWKPYVNT